MEMSAFFIDLACEREIVKASIHLDCPAAELPTCGQLTRRTPATTMQDPTVSAWPNEAGDSDSTP